MDFLSVFKIKDQWMKKTIDFLKDKKRRGVPITMMTCYDYPTALCLDRAEIDVVFVGDSVGTNILGYESETEVTMNDMQHHLKAVRRGIKDAYLLADLPFMAYSTPGKALENAARLLQLGADGVKLEGPLFDIVQSLSAQGIVV
jgi:3-methyl-2-oxobutanoate hydroxymethyltransferase